MKLFLRFFKYVKSYIKPLVTANIFMLLFVLFNILSVGMIMPFVDLLFNENTDMAAKDVSFSVLNFKEYLSSKLAYLFTQYDKSDLLIYICIGIIITFLLKNLFHFLQIYFMSDVEQGVIQDIRLDLYNHFHKLSLSYYTEERKGNLISRVINDVKIINDSIIAVVNSAFRDPPQILSYTLLLFLFNWKLTLILILMLPILSYILSKIGNSIKFRSIKSQEKISDVTTILEETLSAMRIVKAFNMEAHEIKKFKKENRNYFKLLISIIRFRALASPITEMTGVIFITIILFFIGMEIISGTSTITPGAFVLYLTLIFQLMQPLKLFGQVFNSIKEGIAASERVFAVMDTEPAIKDKKDAKVLETFEKDIVFEDVSFKYEKSDLVLQDINFEINKGDVLAVVGPSGAGKSTLVDLIPRFYDPVKGAIKIDGIDLKDYNMKSLRDQMGVVTQETILFNDTIRYNITYGAQNVTDEEMIEAAQAANAHDFISELQGGYDSHIGDRGVKLSGGQRQRLSIARALLNNPPILILDEATSSLDTESELLVQQAIERLMQGRTSIVIAHRLSTVMHATKIIVLENGRIVEEGRHDELLSLNGLYSKLYNMQFKNDYKP